MDLHDDAQQPPQHTTEDDDDDDQQQQQHHQLETHARPKKGFAALGLQPALLRSVHRLGYRMPTPVQRKAIPLALAAHDLVAMARTGSGKTAAFLLPLFQRLGGHSSTVGVRAVVLSPTRELALQTHKFCVDLSHFVTPALRFCVLVGGDAMEAQFERLANNPDVLVATPGRLQHILLDAQLSLSRVEYVVFDEADRLFEMGFAAQLHAILQSMPEARQTLLFSATMPSILADFTRAQLRDPQIVRLDTETKLSDSLALRFVRVRPAEKVAALLILLGRVLSREQQTIVFASTKHHVESLHNLLDHAGLEVTSIYGSLDAAARKIALGKFRAGKARVLVVTDVAARGIDVPLLDNVVNFDFPTKPKLFVHRAGRAARAGRSGTAWSLVEPDEIPYVYDLALYLGRHVSATPTDTVAPAEPAAAAADDGTTIELGRLPSNLIAAEVEFVREVLDVRPELSDLARVAERSTQMYRKSRGDASHASVRRARALPTDVGIHPLLIGYEPNARGEASRSALIAQLATFRPRTADAGGKAAIVSLPGKRKRRQPTATASVQRADDRAARGDSSGAEDGRSDGEAADGHHREREPATARCTSTAAPCVASSATGRPTQAKPKKRSSFRDEEFFMSFTKDADEVIDESEAFLRVGAGDKVDRLQSAVLDLIEDEREGIQRRRSVMKWDARKKKYVRQMLGQVGVGAASSASERGGKRVRDESGSAIKVGTRSSAKGGKAHGKNGLVDGEMYDKWQKSTKKRIQSVGEEETSAARGAGATYNREQRQSMKGGRRWHTATAPLPNANVRSELRSDEQIIKMRKQAEKKRARSGGKGGGGKGGGGKGGGKGGRAGSAFGGRGGGGIRKGAQQNGKTKRGQGRGR